jgi:hypothetical protein
MQSTLTPQETDPHDTFLIEPDVVLATRADHALPDPMHDALSRLAHRAAHTTPGVSVGAPGVSVGAPSVSVSAPDVSAGAPTPTVDTTFRAAAVGTTKVPRQRSAFGRWAKNTSIAFLFALCSAIAAATWRHHSDAAKQLIANWMPPFVLALSSPTATPPPPAEQPDSSPAQANTADQTPAQPAQPSEDTSPTPATASAESTPSVQTPSVQTQSVQSMARDLATMGQQIEQLKASIEQLKAGQAQMSRDIAKTSEAKTSEQNLRPRLATLPPRPVAALTPARKPKPAYPPAQAAVVSTLPPSPSAAPPALPQQPGLPQPALSQPAPQPQVTVESDGGPVVRPPMPLR